MLGRRSEGMRVAKTCFRTYLFTMVLVLGVCAAVVCLTPAAAQAATIDKTVGGAKYRVEIWWGDNDSGRFEWQMEATYLRPASREKASYTIPKTISVRYRGLTKKAPVVSIAKKAFYQCVNAKKINCQASVRFVGDKAFYGCKRLQIFNSEAPISHIGAKAFYGCKSLKSFKSKNKRLTYVGASAFQGCSKLTSIPVLYGVKSYMYSGEFDSACCEIKSKAFYDCKALSRVTVDLNGGCLYVGKSAFANCVKLGKVKVDRGTWCEVVFGVNSFKGCKSLKTIEGIDNLYDLALGKGAFAGTPLNGKIKPYNVHDVEEEDGWNE